MNTQSGRFSSLEVNQDSQKTGQSRGGAIRDEGYYMKTGYKAELAGDHEAALVEYSSALGENPLFIEAWLAQLWMLLYLGEPSEADMWADRALNNYPKQPGLMALKAMALHRCGFIDEARELNDAALGSERESADVWLSRGALHISLDSVATSACFKHALAVSVNRPLTTLRIGDIYLFHRQYADAERYLRQATIELPDSAWVWYEYGLAQKALGWEDSAMIAFAKAAQLAPLDERYRMALHNKKRTLMTRLRSLFNR